VTQEPLWVALLPFGGSVLLFIAAMITLAVTIKSTNNRARADRDATQQRANDDRDAARERDRAAWRRDTLLRLATDAMTATVTAHQQFRRALDAPEHTDAGAEWLDRVTVAGQVIMSASTTLRIIGAPEASSQCIHLRHAVMDEELLQLVGEYARRLQPHRARFEKLLSNIDTRATVFATVIANEIGEPQPKLHVLPGR